MTPRPLVGSLQLPAPRTSLDIIQALIDAGYVPAAGAEDYARMVVFRHRIVHLYNRTDPDLVSTVVQEHLADLERLQRSLVAVIAAHPDRREK